MLPEPQSRMINTKRGHPERTLGGQVRESEVLTQQAWWRESGKEEATFRKKTLCPGAGGEGVGNRAVRPKTGRARILLRGF